MINRENMLLLLSVNFSVAKNGTFGDIIGNISVCNCLDGKTILIYCLAVSGSGIGLLLTTSGV